MVTVVIEYILIVMHEDKHLSNIEEHVLLSNELFQQLPELAELNISII